MTSLVTEGLRSTAIQDVIFTIKHNGDQEKLTCFYTLEGINGTYYLGDGQTVIVTGSECECQTDPYYRPQICELHLARTCSQAELSISAIICTTLPPYVDSM